MYNALPMKEVHPFGNIHAEGKFKTVVKVIFSIMENIIKHPLGTVFTDYISVYINMCEAIKPERDNIIKQELIYTYVTS